MYLEITYKTSKCLYKHVNPTYYIKFLQNNMYKIKGHDLISYIPLLRLNPVSNDSVKLCTDKL